MSWKSAIDSRFGGKATVLAAAVGLVLVAGAVALWARGGDATVTGDSPDERIKKISQLEADDSKAIADAAVGDPDERVRCAAYLKLGQFVSPEARSAVEKGTADKAARVRAAAALALGKYADDAAADRLGKALSADQDEQVRLAAARGLARCNTPKAEDLLVTAMQTNTRNVRIRAMELLLEGKGVRLSPKPDPRNAAVWREHVERVLLNLKATRAGREALGVKE